MGKFKVIPGSSEKSKGDWEGAGSAMAIWFLNASCRSAWPAARGRRSRPYRQRILFAGRQVYASPDYGVRFAGLRPHLTLHDLECSEAPIKTAYRLGFGFCAEQIS